MPTDALDYIQLKGDLGETMIRRGADLTYKPVYEAAKLWMDTSLRAGVSLWHCCVDRLGAGRSVLE